MSRRRTLIDLSYIMSVMCWPFDLDRTAGARSLFGDDSEVESEEVFLLESIQSKSVEDLVGYSE